MRTDGESAAANALLASAEGANSFVLGLLDAAS